MKSSGKLFSAFYNGEIHYYIPSSKSATEMSSFKTKKEKRGKRDREREKAGFLPPLIQDRKAFLEAQPFVCDNCKNFTDTLREFCEICGTRYTIRKATRHDFEKYISKRQTIPVKELVPPLKPISTDVIPKFKKSKTAPINLDLIEDKIIDKAPKPIIRNNQNAERKLQSVPLLTEQRSIKPRYTSIIQPDPISSFSEPKEAESKTSFIRCKFCGMELSEELKFCPQCGYIIKKK
ncbi:MAG: hypothetical protein ACFFB0_07740 [Promethearchaeota archaeon]